MLYYFWSVYRTKETLNVHQAKHSCSVSATDYATQIQAYSQRMQELEAQQEEQKSIATRYAEVKAWLDGDRSLISAKQKCKRSRTGHQK